MDGMSPLQDIFRQKLVNSHWSFGPQWGDVLAESLSFAADGTIGNYVHPNEQSWKIANGRLQIFDREDALMWEAAGRYVQDQVFCIALRSPRDAGAQFVLKEIAVPAPAAAPGAAPEAALPAPPPGPLSPADFLYPKDLAVTPVKFARVRLVGSCMTALYHEAFQEIAPATIFDYLVFNYAGELPAPEHEYDAQYVQLPLRSVLTDRVVWAGQFKDAAFIDDVLRTGYQVIDAMLESALAYTKSHGLLTFVSNFIVPQMSISTSLATRYSKFDIAHLVRALNDYLARALLSHENVILADVNGIAESIGKQYVLDDMINFYAHNGAFFDEWVGYERPARIEPIPMMREFYTSKRQEFTQAVHDQMIALYRTVRQIDQVKAVVFDLDHTLWRGQLAEDYRAGEADWPHPDGWPAGIWEAVHHLRARGILVSICSKNDEAMVRREWENVVRPGFVSLDDFVSVKINWRTKAENILEICRELNIKPMSVVFVDDNPVERAAVKAALPGIRVIGANPYLTRRILLWAPETQVAVLTDESANREAMIRSQISREEERATLTRPEFLASLNCRVNFMPIRDGKEAAFPRVVELVNKTNQFNTTGKRWTQAEILDFMRDGGEVLAFRVVDRFTEYGLVGVLFAQGDRIAQFVMSCRVLGMDIEVFVVAEAVARLRARGAGTVLADLRETADNSPCRDVFLRSGFSALGPGVFELAADAAAVAPAHVRVG